VLSLGRVRLAGLPVGAGDVQVVPHPLARLHAPLHELVRAGRVAEATWYFVAARLGSAGGDELPGKAG